MDGSRGAHLQWFLDLRTALLPRLLGAGSKVRTLPVAESRLLDAQGHVIHGCKYPGKHQFTELEGQALAHALRGLRIILNPIHATDPIFAFLSAKRGNR